MRIVVNDNEVLIEDDEVYINGEAVPYDFGKHLKMEFRMFMSETIPSFSSLGTKF